MKALKIGLTISGLIIPGLTHLRLVEGIESAEKNISMATKNIANMLEDSMTTLRTEIQGGDEFMKRATPSTQMDFSDLRALEGTDLRQLGSFLRNCDHGQVLGNLNRIVTSGGYVRWVCNDHYHEGYRTATVQRFKTIVKANNGWFDELKGHVFVSIECKALAKEFYDTMIKTPGIRELRIALQWEVTQDDLQELSSAATRTGVPSLILHGCLVRKSGIDILKQNKRYNPMVRLMCNGHLESMEIHCFEDFYQHVSSFPIMMTSRLQTLRIQSTFSPNDGSQKSALRFILKHSPLLKELEIATNDLHGAYDFLQTHMERFPNLELLSWKSYGNTVTMTRSQGEIQGFRMAIECCLDELSPDGFKMIQQGHITEFGMSQITEDMSESRIVDVLRSNPGLADMCLKVFPQLSATAVSLVTAAWRIHIEEDMGSSSAGSDTLKVCVDWRDPDNLEVQDMVKMTLDFAGDSDTPTISTRLWMRDTMTPEMIEHTMELIHNYGSTFETVETNCLFTDELAMALENTTEESGSRIISFRLYPRSLTFDGIECFDRIIERSTHMDELHFTLSDMRDMTEREKALHLLDRYNGKLQTLSMFGESVGEWLPEIATACRTRRQLPELTSFNLSSTDKSMIPDECVQWIARMVSAPPTLQVDDISSIPSPLLSESAETAFPLLSQEGQELLSIESGPAVAVAVNHAWKSLVYVSLCYLQLDRKGWRAVINALDLTYLGTLRFDHSNFSLAELRLLIDCIEEDVDNPIDELIIYVTETDASRSTDVDTVRELVKLLGEKAPNVRVFPLDSMV
ncbi:hypothetical protein B0O80DRAFT_447868 [Mortierella sp. GBAus27b]|nr:hypothetical protein B0O80DRAFT_447868 [Mortierella sp. GBAus27b]